MADIAREAGVSRQTLYDRFGDKDGIMAAAISLMGSRICGDTRAAWAEQRDLAARLDAYFEIAVLAVFDLLRTLPDAAEGRVGHCSRAARNKRAAVAALPCAE